MPDILNRLSQGFSCLIVVASMVMLGWGLLGFLEYFTGLAPLMPLQNATFPGGTQFVHWLVITLSGWHISGRVLCSLGLYADCHDRPVRIARHAVRGGNVRFHGE